MTPNTVPRTLHWHRLCNTAHRTFFFLSLSVLQRFPDRMLSLLSLWGTKSPMRNVPNRGCKHCGNTELSSVLGCGFREVKDIVVRIVDEVSCHRPRKQSCPTPWAHKLWEEWTWPGSQTAHRRAECAWPALLGRESSAGWCGRVRRWGRSREWSRSDRQGTADGDGWNMRREKTRSKRDDMRMRRTLEPCVYAISVRHAKKLYQKKVSATRSVLTPPVAQTVVATTWVRTPVGTTPTTKKTKNHHSMTILREYTQTSFKFFLISLTRTWSTCLLSTNHQMNELMLLDFPRHALILSLDDAFVWNFESEFRFTTNYYFQLFECVFTHHYVSWSIM